VEENRRCGNSPISLRGSGLHGHGPSGGQRGCDLSGGCGPDSLCEPILAGRRASTVLPQRTRFLHEKHVRVTTIRRRSNGCTTCGAYLRVRLAILKVGWAFSCICFCQKSTIQPKGLVVIQSYNQRQFLRSTNLKAP
jgi:hypothetical protein